MPYHKWKIITPDINRNKCKRKYNTILLNSSNILLFVLGCKLEALPFFFIARKGA